MIAIRPGTLTSRARVLKAFHHEEPDRVPIDYAANPGIHARFCRALGLRPDNYEGLLRALDVDFRGLALPYTGPVLHAPVPGRNVDPLFGIRTRWIEHEGGGYEDFCDFPLAEAGLETIAAWPMPDPDDFDYGSLPDQCRYHRDKAIYYGSPGLADIINSTGMIRGMEQTLVDLLTGDPAGLLYIDRRLAVQLAQAERALDQCRGHLSFFFIGEDLGTQHAPLIGLDLYREVLRPRHQQFIDLARAYDLPVMIHSCGASSWAFPDFIDMGLSAVDTLQPEAAGMDAERLKHTFGDKLAFHGGITTGGVVAFGTPEETEAEVRRVLRIMMPGGGYCLSPAHMLQDNTPVENLLALYRTGHEAGWYRG